MTTLVLEHLQHADSASPDITIDSSGRVGIGTTTPGSQLTVQGTLGDGSSQAYIDGWSIIGNSYQGNTMTKLNWAGGGARIQGFNSGVQKFEISANSDTYLNGGNVGIGTDDPDSRLHIKAGDSGYTGGIQIEDNDSTTKSAITHVNGTLYISSNTTVDHISILANGKVGIGTNNPAVRLEIKDNNTWDTTNFTSSNAVGSGFTLAATDTGVRWSVIAQGTTGGGNDNNLGYHLTNAGTSGESPGYKFVMTPSGRLGIGTTDPAKTLEIAGDLQLDATDANLWIKSGASGTNGFINWTFNSDSTVYSKVGIDYDTRATTGFHIDAGYPITIDATASGGKAINFAIGGSTKAVVNGSGNVGIGTDNPVKKLDVDGDFYIRDDHMLHMGTVDISLWDNNNGTGGINMRGGTSGTYAAIAESASTGYSNLYLNKINVTSDISENANRFIDFYYDGVSAVRVRGNSSKDLSFDMHGGGNFLLPSGNVGIGTTSPGYKLQVDHSTGSEYVSSIRNTSDNLQLLLGTTTGGLLNIQGKTISSNAAYQIALQAEGGNVGIGIASPNAILHIKDGTNPGTTQWDYRVTADFQASNGNTSHLELTQIRDAGGVNNWQYTGTRLQQRIDSTYMGYMQFNGFSNDYGISWGVGGGTAGPEATPEKMRLKQNGNLGIGTTNPSAKLHVVGAIYATDDVTAYYSDIRLKDVEGNIESALDKVNTLDGFYYTGNDTAKSLGYEKLDREVGVSAQQIEEVLPEAVANIPGNDEYKTVKYERIVPLLIESIKELDKKYQDKIDGLMKEIQALKDKG